MGKRKFVIIMVIQLLFGPTTVWLLASHMIICTSLLCARDGIDVQKEDQNLPAVAFSPQSPQSPKTLDFT